MKAPASQNFMPTISKMLKRDGSSLSPIIDASGVAVTFSEPYLVFKFQGQLMNRFTGNASEVSIHRRISYNVYGNVIVEDLVRGHLYELAPVTCF